MYVLFVSILTQTFSSLHLNLQLCHNGTITRPDRTHEIMWALNYFFLFLTRHVFFMTNDNVCEI